MEKGQDGVEASTNYRRLAVRKGAQDLCYTLFFSFSALSLFVACTN